VLALLRGELNIYCYGIRGTSKKSETVLLCIFYVYDEKRQTMVGIHRKEQFYFKLPITSPAINARNAAVARVLFWRLDY